MVLEGTRLLHPMLMKPFSQPARDSIQPRKAMWSRTRLKLVRLVEVRNFRSIRDVKLENLGNFSAFVGLNNSGKSNFLRALNSFFTDEVEPGQPLRVESDHYRSAIRSRRKKIIRVALHFSLPNEFKFRKGLEPVEQLLGRDCSLTKAWVLGEPQSRFYLNNSREVLSAEDRQKAMQFLSLISFRYVPNRVLPLSIIKEEYQALRDVLIRRLGRKARQRDQVFDLIEKTSSKLIGHLTSDVHSVLGDVDSVRLSTPKSLAEMIFAFGYKISQEAVEFDDAVQGSGVQSLRIGAAAPPRAASAPQGSYGNQEGSLHPALQVTGRTA